jgi:hypothetical protein
MLHFGGDMGNDAGTSGREEDMASIATLRMAAALLAAGAGTAVANSSAYTDFDVKQCETISEDPDGGVLKCEGYKDYPVYFKEGDLRQSMLYGPAAADMLAEAFESFGAFNHVGTKIEWRLDGAGKPFAAIHRWFIDNVAEAGATTPKTAGQVLVISHVANDPADGVSCAVGYVDALANKDANEIARKVADDEALDFACGYQEPAWHGDRGDKASEPMRHLPDRLKVE